MEEDLKANASLIWVYCNDTSKAANEAAAVLATRLASLGFPCAFDAKAQRATESDIKLIVTSELRPSRLREYYVTLSGKETLLERALRVLPMEFDNLPLLVVGDSKIVKLWTDKVVVIRFKPTVYSYTANRYGEVPGTDNIRARFTSALFREMALQPKRHGITLQSAFLAEREENGICYIIQSNIESCNIETRIKRYHVGSPLHRYNYTDHYPSTQGTTAISKWTRFKQPIVCFDWRHPLNDDKGKRLADEPLSDDYAALWMLDIPHAKELSRQTFLWLEERFAEAELQLIDMCLFIDFEGHTIYGEVSPDCMRVHLGLGNPAETEAADKDIWRAGLSQRNLHEKYSEMYRRLYSKDNELLTEKKVRSIS